MQEMLIALALDALLLEMELSVGLEEPIEEPEDRQPQTVEK